MPFVSGNAFFYPLLLVTGIVLIWKGRRRGLVCVALLLLILPLGDHWVCRTIKRAVERPRPFAVLPGVYQPGKPAPPPENKDKPATTVATGSMPSSHAENWFAATMVAFIYFRRSLWIMLPAALLVSFSRIYNGVHYPSDVLAGAILGAGYSAATIWCLEAFWQWAGRKWFPLWWRAFPSLLVLPKPDIVVEQAPPLLRGRLGLESRIADQTPATIPHANVDSHWLRLGYILIAVLLFARLVY